MPERNRPAEPAPHECDLFLLSSARACTAENALGQFARLGGRNLHGWGLGLFQDGRCPGMLSGMTSAHDCGDPACDTCRPPRERCASCGALHHDPGVPYCSLRCAAAGDGAPAAPPRQGDPGSRRAG